MDDNARPHRANLVDEFLESEDIKRIPWPANSPDLNPIENLWDYLGRAIARRHPPPRDVNGLKTALLEEWSLIPQTVINNVISSLKTRCDMCVRQNILEPIFEEEIPTLFGYEAYIDKVELHMNKASSHTSKSTAACLGKKESETETILFDKIRAKSP
ncbi:transposable element Tcb2 transposase [Trichonephila clavipes]|nr:transposable element Tcb2 transposase [Trichonephila clavipes]